MTLSFVLIIFIYMAGDILLNGPLITLRNEVQGLGHLGIIAKDF